MTEQYIFVDPQLKVEIIGDVEAAKAAIDDKPGRVAVRNTSQKFSGGDFGSTSMYDDILLLEILVFTKLFCLIQGS